MVGETVFRLPMSGHMVGILPQVDLGDLFYGSHGYGRLEISPVRSEDKRLLLDKPKDLHALTKALVAAGYLDLKEATGK